MPILSSIIDKILSEETNANQPVSQAVVQKIGQNINALIDQFSSVDSFTTAGVHNWVVPDNTARVLLYGCGGGGGGSGPGDYETTTYWPGGGGGGAACVWQYVDGLTSGDTITVTIGAGGVGGGNQADGGAGGDTLFGSFTRFKGATGGHRRGFRPGGAGSSLPLGIDMNNFVAMNGICAPGGYGVGGGTNGGSISFGELFGGPIIGGSSQGGSSARFNGGITFVDVSTFPPNIEGGGGGGATMFGSGGNGSSVSNIFPYPYSPATSPSPTAFGAGGGGGGSGANRPGAAGMHGALFIFRI